MRTTLQIGLKRRAARIMAERTGGRLDTGRKLLLAAAGMAAVAGPIVFGLMTASPGRAQSQSAPASNGQINAWPGSAASPSSLKFEVASLKPSHTDERSGGIRPAPGGERYVASNVTLKLMIAVAYRVKNDQIAGGPAWIENDRFDMNAKAERPSSVEDLHVMLQNLLAERFQLQFHRETKELPVYALQVDKGGAKLQPHEAQSAGDPWIDVAFAPPKMTWHAKFAPMAYFAWRLSLMLDRPVIDQTAIKGGYDFDLAFSPEMRGAGPAPPDGPLLNGAPMDTSGPTIFEAIRQQLGLKLERQKGPVDIMVIDHVEKPVEN
jgi:uncharacterized protein (TIGR03435 family)